MLAFFITHDEFIFAHIQVVFSHNLYFIDYQIAKFNVHKYVYTVRPGIPIDNFWKSSEI